MGASDIMGNFAGNTDDLRAAKNNRDNPPEFAPGQSDNFFGEDAFDTGSNGFGDPFATGGSGGMGADPFASGGAGGFSSAGADPFGNTGLSAGGGFNAGGAGTWGGGTQGFNSQINNGGMMNGQPQDTRSSEDKIFDGLAKSAKGVGSFLKAFVGSFKHVTPKFWASYGSNTLIASLILAGVGIVSRLFGVTMGTQLFIGGCLSGGAGVIILMCNVDKAKSCTSKYKDDNAMQAQQPAQDMLSQTTPPVQPDAFSASSDFGAEDDFDAGTGDWGSDDDGWGDDGDFNSASSDDFAAGGSDDFFSGVDDVIASDTSEPVDPDEAFEKLPDVPAGMYTRQYLYETFTKVLPNLKPDFYVKKEIDINSDTALVWDRYLKDAAEATGAKEGGIPDLLKLEENLFTIILTCSRPVGLKVDAVANELANIYAYSSGTFNEKVYAQAVAFGKQCVITLFTGESAMVSLKDMYAQVEDKILDTKNYMPVVFGVDQQGKVIWCDLAKLESALVAGMPRSGKTWLVQTLITQMCAFVPPSELNLYIFDPKAGTSDFRFFVLPHVRAFATRYKNDSGGIVNEDGKDILVTMREIVRQEVPRRKKLIGDAGCSNIWEFRKKNPDVSLPLLYVIIDEAVTLSEDMDKEDKAEYQSYVTQLVTQFPNLGIRMIMIPHVVKDQVIKKTASDSIKCRISVKGSPEHIESSTGTKPRNFPYKLCNVGDMAVNIPDIQQQTMFVHSVILSKENETNNGIFDYMAKVWGKLEPECLNGAYFSNRATDKANKKVLEQVNQAGFLDDVDDIDLFGEGNQSSTGATNISAEDMGNKAETGSDFDELNLFTDSDDKGLSGISQSAVDSTADNTLGDLSDDAFFDFE